MIKYLSVGVLVTALTSPCFATGGTDTGNGLNFQRMLEAELNNRETMARKDFEGVVVDVGYEFKKDILLPTYDYFLSLDLSLPEYQGLDQIEDVRRIQLVFKENQVAVRRDIELTYLRIHPCDGSGDSIQNTEKHKDLCTGEPGQVAKPYDPINIDVEAILENRHGMTASQFVGAVFHEFVHHHIDPIRNHDEYGFSRFIELIVRTHHFRVKKTTYDMKSILRKVKYGDKEVWALFVDHKISAENFRFGNSGQYGRVMRFCRLKGHSANGSVSYEVAVLTSEEKRAYSRLNGDDRNGYLYHIVPNELQEGEPFSIQVMARRPGAFNYEFYKSITCEDRF